MDQQHPFCRHSLGQAGDQCGQSMDDGVQNLTLAHDHQDAARDAHDQSAHGNILGTGNEIPCHLVGLRTAQNTAQNAHAQEHGGNVQHAPAELHDSHHDDDESAGQRQQHQNVPGAQRHILNGDLLVLLGQLQVPHIAELRIFPDLAGIAQNAQGHRHYHDQPHGDTQRHTGKGGQFRDLLGHAHGEGVQEAGGKADGGAERHHGHSHNGVIAQGAGQGDADGDKDDGLLRHTEGGAAQGKHEHHHGNDELFPALQAVGQFLDAVFHGAGLRDDVEGTTHHENEHHDIGHLHHAVGNGVEETEKAHRALGHIGKGIGIHHLTVGSFIEDPLVAAGGDHITADRHKGDDAEQNNKRMGKCQLSLSFFFHGKASSLI